MNRLLWLQLVRGVFDADAEGSSGAGGGAGGDAAPGGSGGDAVGTAGAGAGDAAGGADGAGDGAEPSLLAGAVGKAKDGEAGGEKPAEAEKPGDKKPDEKPAEAPAADVAKDVDGNPIPEAYELKAPDGMQLDAKLIEEVTPLFKEAKLSPAQAQVVTDAYAKITRDQIAAHADQVAQWQKDAKADPEIGKAKFEENLGKAAKAFQAFGNERAMQIFDTYGLGNNPDILRMFVRMGDAIGEGGTILPGHGVGRVSDAEALYGSSARK